MDAINLGQLGHGPLSEYASLLEYNQNNIIKKVVWVFNPGNDLRELELELKNKILLKYFTQKNFTQNLIKNDNKK